MNVPQMVGRGDLNASAENKKAAPRNPSYRAARMNKITMIDFFIFCLNHFISYHINAY